jgi:hypothetical protein
MVVRADEGVRGLREQNRFRRNSMAGLGCVVTVIQSNAEDLMRSGYRCTDAFPRKTGYSVPTIVDERSKHGESAVCEECFIEVLDDVGDVDVKSVVDVHNRTFLPDCTNSHQAHEVLSKIPRREFGGCIAEEE